MHMLAYLEPRRLGIHVQQRVVRDPVAVLVDVHVPGYA